VDKYVFTESHQVFYTKKVHSCTADAFLSSRSMHRTTLPVVLTDNRSFRYTCNFLACYVCDNKRCLQKPVQLVPSTSE